MVMKLPGRTLASAGMNSPPEDASKIVTLRMSPTPKRRSLGRLRSMNDASLGAAFPRTAVIRGVTGTSAYERTLGSRWPCCCQMSIVPGPLMGKNPQPPSSKVIGIRLARMLDRTALSPVPKIPRSLYATGKVTHHGSGAREWFPSSLLLISNNAWQKWLCFPGGYEEASRDLWLFHNFVRTRFSTTSFALVMSDQR